MKKTTAVIIAITIFTNITHASQSIGWRGDGTGRFINAKPPVNWSPTKNIIWKTKLPDWSNASPVLQNDRIYICVEPATLMCLSAINGNIIWQQANMYSDILSSKELKKNITGIPKTHNSNGYSSPTPITDGKSVFAVFGNGVAASYDLNGKRNWAQIVGKPSHSWGHSASPVLAGDTLIIHMGKEIIGLNPKTGEAKWKTPGQGTWGTPAVANISGQAIIITTGGDIIRVKDGKRIGNGVGSMPYTSPIAEKGVVYVADQNGAKASKLPAIITDKIKLDTLWTLTPQKDRYYASPVCYGGILYIINQRGWLSTIDIKTGKLIYEKKLNLKAIVYTSITLAGDKLYVSGEKGHTIVFATGRTYKEIAQNKLEPFRSCPVFSGSRMYIRGKEYMWCIGK